MPPASRHEPSPHDRGTFLTRPLTSAVWLDLEDLFNLPGGSVARGCWCMFYRTSGQALWGQGVAARRQALCDLAGSGPPPGIIGYLDGSPAGWISLGPREDFPKLLRSPVMKPVDDTPVWSVVCSFVAVAYRGQGLQHRLLSAAVEFARDSGASTLEAYPVDKDERHQDEAMWFGSRSLYENAGFHEVARRSPTRVVMRCELGSS